MRKGKIILFTLLLSTLGIIGSIKAAGVNTLVESNSLSSVMDHQSVQSSILENIEGKKNKKPILWTSKFQEFKQKGQITADSNNMGFGAIGAGGAIDIGADKTGGCTENTVSKASAASVIGLSSSSGEKNGKVIVRSFSSLKSETSHSSRSSSSSYSRKKVIIDNGSRSVSIITPSLESSKSSPSLPCISASSTNKDIHRHPGWCPEKSSGRNKSSVSSSLMKKGSSSLTTSSSSMKKLPNLKSTSMASSQSLGLNESKVKSSSIIKRLSMTDSSLSNRSSNWKSSSTISKSSEWVNSSLIRGNKRHSHRNIIIVVPIPAKENSISISLSKFSSTIKVPTKIDYSSEKLTKVSKKVNSMEPKTHKSTKNGKVKPVKSAKTKAKDESYPSRKERVVGLLRKQVAKSDGQQVSQPIADQNGDLHLDSQQFRTLKHEMYFSNSKAAKAVKKMSIYKTVHGLTATKQGLMLKHQDTAHSTSKVHRIKLTIQGILPATRMDSYTWLYSLIGLVIMIVSGGAFFSKKRK